MKTVADYLKYAPEGTELYSPVIGACKLDYIEEPSHHIHVVRIDNKKFVFTKEGRFLEGFSGECVLFPSKEERVWTVYTVPYSLKPFAHVIVRQDDDDKKPWHCSIFSHYDKSKAKPYVMITGLAYKYCLPCNEDTEKLIGTFDE